MITNKPKLHSLSDTIRLLDGDAVQALSAIIKTIASDKKMPASELPNCEISNSEIFTSARHMRADAPSAMFSAAATLMFHSLNGAGTTTLAANIAATLSLRGLRVCLIDCDPGAYETITFGYEPDYTHQEATDLNIYREKIIDGHVGNLLQSKNIAEIVKRPFGNHGPHLIPADPTLIHADNVEPDSIKKLISAGKNQLLGEHCDLSGYEVFILDCSRNTPRDLLVSAIQAANTIAILTPQNRNDIRKTKNFIRNTKDLRKPGELRFAIIPRSDGEQKIENNISSDQIKITTPLHYSEEHTELLEEHNLATISTEVPSEIRENINCIATEILDSCRN